MSHSLETERLQLEDERFARFAAAAAAVNAHLSRIFCRLSGLQGDAYCSHSSSCALLAAQGVAFHVRHAPPGSPLRCFSGPSRVLPCMRSSSPREAAALLAQARQPQLAGLRSAQRRAAGTREPGADLCTAGPLLLTVLICIGPAWLLLLDAQEAPHINCCRCVGMPCAAQPCGTPALRAAVCCMYAQAAHPSPFYFFDELDAALDSSNAARVAAYIRSQTRGQYIVVTHKPQVGAGPHMWGQNSSTEAYSPLDITPLSYSFGESFTRSLKHGCPAVCMLTCSAVCQCSSKTSKKATAHAGLPDGDQSRRRIYLQWSVCYRHHAIPTPVGYPGIVLVLPKSHARTRMEILHARRLCIVTLIMFATTPKVHLQKGTVLPGESGITAKAF